MSEKETKKIKKEFSIYEFENEERFLEEQSALGWHFKSLDKGNYIFEKDEGKEENEYLIDFFTEPLTEETVKVYNDEGFTITYIMNSGKDGIWYYFSRILEENNPPKKHQVEGRVFLLTRVKNRIERFGLVIMAVSLGYFGFAYFRFRETIYLVTLLFVGAMSIYFYKIYRDIKNKIKEYESNT